MKEWSNAKSSVNQMHFIYLQVVGGAICHFCHFCHRFSGKNGINGKNGKNGKKSDFIRLMVYFATHILLTYLHLFKVTFSMFLLNTKANICTQNPSLNRQVPPRKLALQTPPYPFPSNPIYMPIYVFTYLHAWKLNLHAWHAYIFERIENTLRIVW